jgi:hypothetical protein
VIIKTELAFNLVPKDFNADSDSQPFDLSL